MSVDLEARVVQAAREACVQNLEWADPGKLLVLSGTGDQYVEVRFAILGARAALAEIEKMIGGHLTVVLLAVRDEDNYE